MTTSDRKADLGMRLDMGPGNADMHEWEWFLEGEKSDLQTWRKKKDEI